MKPFLRSYFWQFLNSLSYRPVLKPVAVVVNGSRWASPLLTIAFTFWLSSGIRAQDVLVGLTSLGGAENGGTAFTMKSDGTGFTVRKNFVKSGSTPNGNLIKATDGNFYGLNSGGGTYGYGNIFKMSAAGKITNLHSFNSATDGSYPQGSLKQGTDGDFYGLAYGGGTNGYGTVFKITAGGVFTVLRHLDSATDGANPYDNLTQGTDGDFYGLNSNGGTNGYGTIFKITPDGTYSVLRHFNQTTDGSYPFGGLVQGGRWQFLRINSVRRYLRVRHYF